MHQSIHLAQIILIKLKKSTGDWRESYKKSTETYQNKITTLDAIV
jgi:hypothetical protein